MAWKSTIPWLSSGAVVALGYLWARRTPGSRAGLPQLSRDAARRGHAGELRDINLDPDVNLDAIAHADAVHDMGRLDDNADFDADTKVGLASERDPSERDPLDLELDFDVDVDLEMDATVGPNDHATLADEPYDALDAEDVGTAFLRRATQVEPSEDMDVGEALEGTHEIVEGDPALMDLARESDYGTNRTGASLMPYAGTHEEDVATELPVGTLDSSGNAEFHAPLNPPDAFGAPPTGTLSPTEQEMARRDAAHAADQHGSRR
jgi:hypothetical protein